MPFNQTIKQLTTQTRNHASNFNEVNNQLLENTIYNKEQLELLKTQAVEWEEVSGKPTTFPAEEHRHNVSEIDGFENIGGEVTWDSITGKPSTFPPSPHTHSQLDLTDKYLDGRGTGNKPPSFYKGKGHYLELVNGSEVALSAFPNSCTLETICAWHDTTGGVRQRISPSGTNVTYHRYSTSDTAWSGWVRSNDGGNADTVDGKHASDFASATGVNNNLKLGQYVKFYDYDDGGSDTTMKQAYLRDGKWITGFTDITVGGSGTGFQQQINDLKSSVSSIKVIKSIQRGVFTYSGNNVQTINISAVNMSKSVIILGGSWCKKSDVGYLPHLNLTSSTQITVTRGWTSESYDTSVAWQVIEFY